MDFLGGFLRTKKGHGYIFVVVDMFNKMCILIPCKNTLKGKDARNMSFEKFWVHFGISRRIILDRDNIFLSVFWTTLWENIDTKFKISTTFHPHIEGQTKAIIFFFFIF
jgi:hypothetical protein